MGKSFCPVYSHDLTKVLQDPPFTWTQLSMHEALVLLRRFGLMGAFAASLAQSCTASAP